MIKVSLLFKSVDVLEREQYLLLSAIKIYNKSLDCNKEKTPSFIVTKS